MKPLLMTNRNAQSGNYREGSDIGLILISEDFRDHDYWSRIDLLSEAIYDAYPYFSVSKSISEQRSSAYILIVLWLVNLTQR